MCSPKMLAAVVPLLLLAAAVAAGVAAAADNSSTPMPDISPDGHELHGSGTKYLAREVLQVDCRA